MEKHEIKQDAVFVQPQNISLNASANEPSDNSHEMMFSLQFGLNSNTQESVKDKIVNIIDKLNNDNFLSDHSTRCAYADAEIETSYLETDKRKSDLVENHPISLFDMPNCFKSTSDVSENVISDHTCRETMKKEDNLQKIKSIVLGKSSEGLELDLESNFNNSVKHEIEPFSINLNQQSDTISDKFTTGYINLQSDGIPETDMKLQHDYQTFHNCKTAESEIFSKNDEIVSFDSKIDLREDLVDYKQRMKLDAGLKISQNPVRDFLHGMNLCGEDVMCADIYQITDVNVIKMIETNSNETTFPNDTKNPTEVNSVNDLNIKNCEKENHDELNQECDGTHPDENVFSPSLLDSFEIEKSKLLFSTTDLININNETENIFTPSDITNLDLTENFDGKEMLNSDTEKLCLQRPVNLISDKIKISFHKNENLLDDDDTNVSCCTRNVLDNSMRFESGTDNTAVLSHVSNSGSVENFDENEIMNSEAENLCLNTCVNSFPNRPREEVFNHTNMNLEEDDTNVINASDNSIKFESEKENDLPPDDTNSDLVKHRNENDIPNVESENICLENSNKSVSHTLEEKLYNQSTVLKNNANMNYHKEKQSLFDYVRNYVYTNKDEGNKINSCCDKNGELNFKNINYFENEANVIPLYDDLSLLDEAEDAHHKDVRPKIFFKSGCSRLKSFKTPWRNPDDSDEFREMKKIKRGEKSDSHLQANNGAFNKSMKTSELQPKKTMITNAGNTDLVVKTNENNPINTSLASFRLEKVATSFVNEEEASTAVPKVQPGHHQQQLELNEVEYDGNTDNLNKKSSNNECSLIHSKKKVNFNKLRQDGGSDKKNTEVLCLTNKEYEEVKENYSQHISGYENTFVSQASENLSEQSNKLKHVEENENPINNQNVLGNIDSSETIYDSEEIIKETKLGISENYLHGISNYFKSALTQSNINSRDKNEKSTNIQSSAIYFEGYNTVPKELPQSKSREVYYFEDSLNRKMPFETVDDNSQKLYDVKIVGENICMEEKNADEIKSNKPKIRNVEIKDLSINDNGIIFINEKSEALTDEQNELHENTKNYTLLINKTIDPKESNSKTNSTYGETMVSFASVQSKHCRRKTQSMESSNDKTLMILRNNIKSPSCNACNLVNAKRRKINRSISSESTLTMSQEIIENSDEDPFRSELIKNSVESNPRRKRRGRKKQYKKSENIRNGPKLRSNNDSQDKKLLFEMIENKIHKAEKIVANERIKDRADSKNITVVFSLLRKLKPVFEKLKMFLTRELNYNFAKKISQLEENYKSLEINLNNLLMDNLTRLHSNYKSEMSSTESVPNTVKDSDINIGDSEELYIIDEIFSLEHQSKRSHSCANSMEKQKHLELTIKKYNTSPVVNRTKSSNESHLSVQSSNYSKVSNYEYNNSTEQTTLRTNQQNSPNRNSYKKEGVNKSPSLPNKYLFTSKYSVEQMSPRHKENNSNLKVSVSEAEFPDKMNLENNFVKSETTLVAMTSINAEKKDICDGLGTFMTEISRVDETDIEYNSSNFSPNSSLNENTKMWNNIHNNFNGSSNEISSKNIRKLPLVHYKLTDSNRKVNVDNEKCKNALSSCKKDEDCVNLSHHRDDGKKITANGICSQLSEKTCVLQTNSSLSDHERYVNCSAKYPNDETDLQKNKVFASARSAFEKPFESVKLLKPECFMKKQDYFQNHVSTGSLEIISQSNSESLLKHANQININSKALQPIYSKLEYKKNYTSNHEKICRKKGRPRKKRFTKATKKALKNLAILPVKSTSIPPSENTSKVSLTSTKRPSFVSKPLNQKILNTNSLSFENSKIGECGSFSKHLPENSNFKEKLRQSDSKKRKNCFTEKNQCVNESSEILNPVPTKYHPNDYTPDSQSVGYCIENNTDIRSISKKSHLMNTLKTNIPLDQNDSFSESLLKDLPGTKLDAIKQDTVQKKCIDEKSGFKNFVKLCKNKWKSSKNSKHFFKGSINARQTAANSKDANFSTSTFCGKIVDLNNSVNNDFKISQQNNQETTKTELSDVIELGILKPGYKNLTVHTPEKLHFASIDDQGCICSETGKSYNTLREWCMQIPNFSKEGENITDTECLKRVYYEGRTIWRHKEACQEFNNHVISGENTKFSEIDSRSVVPKRVGPINIVLNLSKMKLLLIGDNEVEKTIPDADLWVDIDKW